MMRAYLCGPIHGRTADLDNAIRLAMHYHPRGITIHDVLLYSVAVKQPTREQIKARLVALANDGEIEATAKGWVKVQRGADADPTSRGDVAVSESSSSPNERAKV